MIRERIKVARQSIDAGERAIAAARAELDDLQLAESVLLRLSKPAEYQTVGMTLPFQAETTTHAQSKTENGNPYKEGTNKALFYAVLYESESPWLTANEVQERSSNMRGWEIPMSSVSPGLSDMKASGVIERDGLKVALKNRLAA